MARPEDADCWLVQANADLLAANAEHQDIAECHRRFWIQQSYEKAIKAYAIIRWSGAAEDERQFARLFLLKHSPLKTLASAGDPLPKSLHMLSREVEVFVRELDNSDLLLRIDAAEAVTDPDQVSYRYPFLVEDELKAPSEYEDWNVYQGNRTGALAAVRRLIAAVRDELRVARRRPS